MAWEEYIKQAKISEQNFAKNNMRTKLKNIWEILLFNDWFIFKKISLIQNKIKKR